MSPRYLTSLRDRSCFPLSPFCEAILLVSFSKSFSLNGFIQTQTLFVLFYPVKVQSTLFSRKGNNDHTSSWTSSSSSISSASINSRGSLQSCMRVILTKRTENIYWNDNDISPPWYSPENYLKLCWCFSSLISTLRNPFQLSCSFTFPTSGFFLVLLFPHSIVNMSSHELSWTAIVSPPSHLSSPASEVCTA